MIDQAPARFLVHTIIAVALWLPLPASAGIFLQLGDLKGEATDVDHVDWIEILSVSESISNAGTVGHVGGGGGAGKVEFGPLQLVKLLDLSSVDLRSNLARGTHFGNAVIEVTDNSAARSRTYFRYRLTNVLVTSISLSADGDSVPVENFSLVFEKIEWEYIPQDSKGSAGSPVRSGYDLTTAKPL